MKSAVHAAHTADASSAARPADELSGVVPLVDAAGDAGPERRTRTDVILRLLVDGPSTATRLAQVLDLSGTAVRRHLDVLTEEGAITSREEKVLGRRGRGRPARVYVLTDIGRKRLPHAYDDLAAQALDYLAENIGPGAVADFARRRAEQLVGRVRDELDSAESVAERARILARALTGSGYAASVDRVGVGEQLSQHHCPVAHVASRYPQLCEAELAVFTEALGTYTQRLATIARGDSFCTTFIPETPPDPAHRPVGHPHVPAGAVGVGGSPPTAVSPPLPPSRSASTSPSPSVTTPPPQRPAQYAGLPLGRTSI